MKAKSARVWNGHGYNYLPLPACYVEDIIKNTSHILYPEDEEENGGKHED